MLQPDTGAQLYALQELAFQLNRSFDPATIMQCAVEWSAGMGMGAAIWRVQAEQGVLTLDAYAGLPDPLVAQLLLLPSDCDQHRLPGYAIVQRILVHVDDTQHDQRFDDLPVLANTGLFRAALALPLLAGDQCQGALTLFAATSAAFSPPSVSLYELLARQVALALDNAQTVADLRARETTLEQRNTQLRRAYALVAAERRTLAAVLDSARDAVLVTDAYGVVQIGNPAVETVLGIHPDLLIGQPLYQTEAPAHLVLLVQQAQARQGAQEGELALLDGRVFHVSIGPIKPLYGSIQGYVTMLKDITHFKRLDEMKSEFVSSVSHDLKSPLNIIGGYTELLELDGPLNEDQQTHVERIRASIRQLTTLVTNLLDLARIEAHVGIHMGACNMGEIVRVVADAFALMAAEKHIQLAIQHDPLLPNVHGDRERLQQVVSNLLSNALTYTPTNGSVQISAEVDTDRLIVRVQDTGIGISPHELPHIFDPFFRSNRARETNGEGTGLGLAIVKRIVEEHNGQVGVESAANAGSTFWFALPIALA